MIENAHVETASFIWLIVGAVLWIAVPVAIAIIWELKKKGNCSEPLLTAGRSQRSQQKQLSKLHKR